MISRKNETTVLRHKVHQLLEDNDRVVDNSLLGFATLHNGLIVLQDCKAILRGDYIDLSDKVKIISGAGAGNEPSHIGFVGSGMLTASITGNLFSAPSSLAILDVIEEIGTDHSPGILLIVQNRAGYNINFGLAKLRAQKRGFNIEMIIVEDDAIENFQSNMPKRQGLSGVIFMHKIAGAMAEEGQSLNDIHTACQRIIKSRQLVSVSVCLKPSLLTKSAKSQEEPTHEIEIGCGTHGEIGNKKVQCTSWKDIAIAVTKLMVNTSPDESYSSTTSDIKKFQVDDNVAVLVNNLGGCSQMEGNAFALEIVLQLKALGLNVLRTYVGSLMTLPSVNGFHVSLLNLSLISRLLNYLDAPTSAPAWPRTSLSIEMIDNIAKKHRPSASSDDLPFVEPQGPEMNQYGKQVFCTTVIFACEALIACTEQLNAMDSDSGDGDCGTTLARGAHAVIFAIKENKISFERPFVSLTQIGYIIDRFMGGLQGGLYSIFFEAAATAFAKCGSRERIMARTWLDALIEGIEAISQFGNVTTGECTMLDPLIAAQKELSASLNSGENILAAFGKTVKAAERSAVETVFTKESLRHFTTNNNYKMYKYPDAGAHAVGIWMRAAYEGAKLKLSCYL